MHLFYQWKAAKEELHENEEDEPENAYKILERKRQKEIEVSKLILCSRLFIHFHCSWSLIFV